MSRPKFITLYSKKGWSVGYYPGYGGMAPSEFIEIMRGQEVNVSYAGKIVRQGTPQIPPEVKEVYYFWCAMLEE